MIRPSSKVRSGSQTELQVVMAPANCREQKSMVYSGEMPQEVTHTGEEFLHVLKGVVEVFIALTRHILKTGDSIHFDSSEPHTLRNIGDAEARLLWVARPPFIL